MARKGHGTLVHPPLTAGTWSDGPLCVYVSMCAVCALVVLEDMGRMHLAHAMHYGRAHLSCLQISPPLCLTKILKTHTRQPCCIPSLGLKRRPISSCSPLTCRVPIFHVTAGMVRGTGALEALGVSLHSFLKTALARHVAFPSLGLHTIAVSMSDNTPSFKVRPSRHRKGGHIRGGCVGHA